MFKIPKTGHSPTLGLAQHVWCLILGGSHRMIRESFKQPRHSGIGAFAGRTGEKPHAEAWPQICFSMVSICFNIPNSTWLLIQILYLFDLFVAIGFFGGKNLSNHQTYIGPVEWSHGPGQIPTVSRKDVELALLQARGLRPPEEQTMVTWWRPSWDPPHFLRNLHE